jgi:hypothetical protein
MKITIEVDLPDDVANHVLAIQEVEPDFLSRVILYGVTRRQLYVLLRDGRESMTAAMMEHVFTDEERALLRERDSLRPGE